jgi:hypothetical protein
MIPPKRKEREMGNETKTALRLFSEDDPFIIEDYPWGYRLRTQVRVWMECRKGHGMRVCRQTQDPRTGRWCKPKKSTYSCVLGFYLNEEGRIKTCGLSAGGWSKEEAIVAFEEFYAEIGLTDFQKDRIKYIRATNVMNDVIDYSIHREGDGPVQTKEEQEAIVNKAFNYGMAVAEGQVEHEWRKEK